jgi:hypothetical protein
MKSFMLRCECDTIIFKIIFKCFGNSLWSHALSICHDLCVARFLEKKVMPMKIYNFFGKRYIIFNLHFCHWFFHFKYWIPKP